MTENKRFRKGKSILTDFPTDAIIDEETGERYYDGIKPDYVSSNELVQILKKLHDEKEMWKRECKRLKGLYYLENGNVELDDIIGLVKTDEPTNSVELKKELYK